MDLIMTTSRGKGMGEIFGKQKHLFNINKKVITISGATIDHLTNKALDIIANHPSPSSIHVYFIAGIPDITTMIRDVGYEEVIFIEDPITAHSHFITKATRTINRIIQAQAIPCLATIAPMSIDTWNHTRLHQHKTNYLIHFNQYEDMQALLNQTLIHINTDIIKLNTVNNMLTPKLATQILHKQNTHRSYRTRFGRLTDGVHPNTETQLHWAGDIINCIANNRS